MERQTGRLEAFSDGVFGVAITLLAIEINIRGYEHATNESLWNKIIEKWPEYFAYFNSFATLLLVWLGHHKIIKSLHSVNHWIILLNGLVLLCVVFFPYPTRTVSTFIYTDARNTAVSFYAASTGLIVLSMLFLIVGIVKHPNLLVSPDKSRIWLRAMISSQLLAISVYAIAAVLAFYQPIAALLITFCMWVFWAIRSKDKE